MHCGGVQSTEWLVTVYKGINLVGQPPQYYFLNARGTTFDPATQQEENPCPKTEGGPSQFSQLGLCKRR